MATSHRIYVVDGAGLQELQTPRTDLLVERTSPENNSIFAQLSGPFAQWTRTLDITEQGEDSFQVRETVSFRLAVPHVWRYLVHGMIRLRLLRSDERYKRPAWAPSEQLDQRAATVMGLLATVAVLTGYLGTLVSQTMTFAAEEFESSDAAQGRALAVIRLGVVISLVVVWAADRVGRRRMLVVSVIAGILLATTGALANSLWALAFSQTLARPFATAMFILLVVIAAEELPAGSRALGMSLLAMASAFGAALALVALVLADEPFNSWRLIYLLPLLGLGVALSLVRHLPESKRFEKSAGMGAKWYPGHGGVILKLGAVAFLVSLLIAPAAQLRNEFLRDNQGLSASMITLFVLATATPAGLGVLLGGQLSDTKGRRKLASLSLAFGSLRLAIAFLSTGFALWAMTLIGGFTLALAGPSLSSYGPELFPTRMRARANSIVSVIGTAGSAAGLLIAGELSDFVGGLGRALSLMAIGPVIAAGIVWFRYPETARRELEDINPEDRAVGTS
ncbi:MAG: MFS transporter [Acidimicrobiales bacterium]